MRAFTFEEFIARPPERVWAVLTDLTVAPRWRPMIVSMETEDGGPLRVGGNVKIVAEALGKRGDRVSRTTTFERNRRWTLHSGEGSEIEGWYEFRLEAEGSGTRVIATCDLEAHGILSRLFLFLIGNTERRMRVEMLGNLKRVVEST